MPNVRPLNKDKYQISEYRFRELYYWCLQYKEWENGHEQYRKLVEQTAIETDPDISRYIIKAVTEKDITYNYLKMVMKIPCGQNMYYDRRRKFYCLLSKKKYELDII